MKTPKQLYRTQHKENMFEVDSCRILGMREIGKAEIGFIWKVNHNYLKYYIKIIFSALVSLICLYDTNM